MKSIKQQKLDVLFRFCNQYGFEQTVDEITAGIGISKKTFFNRYQNREEMTKMVQQYWRELFKSRFEEKKILCNNSVEIILLFIYELQVSNKTESVYIKQEITSGTYLEHLKENHFIPMIRKVIIDGIDNECFDADIDIDLFCHYFIYNIFHLYLNQLNIELINYFLQPLLTELGKTLLEDIDLERMFTFAIPIFDSSFKKFQ